MALWGCIDRKECGLYNLEFHDKDTEAPQEYLCVLCAFVV